MSYFNLFYNLQLYFFNLKIKKQWKINHCFFNILIMDEKVLVLCEKWLLKFLSNLYVLRPPESEKTESNWLFIQWKIQKTLFKRRWKKIEKKEKTYLRGHPYTTWTIFHHFLTPPSPLWTALEFIRKISTYRHKFFFKVHILLF